MIALSKDAPDTFDDLREAFRLLVDRSSAPRQRGLYEWAQRCLIIPEGEHKDWPWSPETQPYAALLFREIDSGQWRRVAALGCVQSGKTLHAFVAPALHTLFELGETFIAGVPTGELAETKWSNELLPAIKASQYRSLLPTTGPGSAGGFADEILFRNGARLKWMTGHGGDEKRSGATSRVVAVTEADKMDKSALSSRETDPVSQIEARTESYPEHRRRAYLECTVSTHDGRIWQEYVHGSRSRIVCKCPHCGEWVTPEKEHLIGWESARSEKEAEALSAFVCPRCSETITEQQRVEMNHAARLLHGDQQIDRDGNVTGEPPGTYTLGFRWNAFNNLFWTSAKIGVDMWRAARSDYDDDVTRRVDQFVWATPWTPPNLEAMQLDQDATQRRTDRIKRGVVPEWCDWVTMGIDIGDTSIHWVLLGSQNDATSAVLDYGVLHVNRDYAPEVGIDLALRKAISKWLEEGWWTWDQHIRTPDHAWVDARWRTDTIRRVCREIGGKVFLPSLGCGADQHYTKQYMEPTARGNTVVHVGERYHFKWLKNQRQHEVEVDADHWKTHAIARLNQPLDKPGACRLFDAEPQDHAEFVRHLTAEEFHEEFDKKQNRTVRKWVRKRRRNHYLDCLYLATAAAHYCGVRLVPDPQQAEKKLPSHQPYVPPPDDAAPDGRSGLSYAVRER